MRIRGVQLLHSVFEIISFSDIGLKSTVPGIKFHFRKIPAEQNQYKVPLIIIRFRCGNHTALARYYPLSLKAAENQFSHIRPDFSLQLTIQSCVSDEQVVVS